MSHLLKVKLRREKLSLEQAPGHQVSLRPLLSSEPHLWDDCLFLTQQGNASVCVCRALSERDVSGDSQVCLWALLLTVRMLSGQPALRHLLPHEKLHLEFRVGPVAASYSSLGWEAGSAT